MKEKIVILFYIFIENNPYQHHLLLMINLRIFHLIKDIHIFFLRIKIITMEDEVVELLRKIK